MKKVVDFKQKPLQGKTIVITGGTSGVGRAAVEAFALEGCSIVVAARGQKGLDEVVELCRNLNVPVIGVQTDVSDAEQVKKLAERALELNGRIDIWLNNAGVMASGKFEEIPLEISEQVIKTNLMGYMYGAYNVLPIFKKQGHGILINNVSIGGFMPAPYSAVYSATKGGIKTMMECLQGEISNEPHIHICNLYPQIQRSTGNSHSAKYSGLDFKVMPFAADPRDTAQAFVSLAKKPKKDKFPDGMSYFIKTIHAIFPNAIVNTASAVMRLMMKIKNAPPSEGNILEKSEEPLRIYGETALPIPSKKTKKTFLIGAGLGLAYWLIKRKFKK